MAARLRTMSAVATSGSIVHVSRRRRLAMREPRRDRGLERRQLLGHRDAARLLVPMVRIVHAVGDVLAAVILARPRPQIRAVAAPEIAPAVVLLALVEDALDRPRFHLVERVRRHGERVDRALVPLKRRTAALRPPGGGVRGAPLE